MPIHPTAIIDPKAKIGRDVIVDPYAIIGPDVQLGDRCHIHSHAVLEFATLGEDCQVYPFASVGLAPQHLGYKGEPTKIVVGNRCTFRESVTAHRGTLFDNGITTIGNDCYFMGAVHIAHDCVVGNNVIMANGSMLAGHVQVGDRVFVSAMAAFHQFVRVGSYAMISGGAMVSLDVAPFCTVQGDRASLKGLNLVGMKRAGIDRSTIKLIKEAYKTVFLQGLTLKEALASPIFTSPDPSLKVFLDFLSVPKRGFTRPEETFIHLSKETEEASA